VIRRRHLRLWLSAGLFAALSVMLVAPAVSAQEADDQGAPPLLLAIDATDDSYVLVRTAEPPTDVAITIAGAPVVMSPAIPIGRSTLGIDTMLVIDNSVRVDDLLEHLVAAAVDYVQRAPAGENIGVYTTGGAALLRIGLNDNHERTVEAIQAIVTSNDESRLWDGIRGAALELRAGEAGRTNMVVFVGSADGGSTSTISGSRGAVLAARASTYIVANDNETVPLDDLGQLAAVSLGGQMITTTDQNEIAAAGASVSAVIGGTYLLPFTSDALGDNRSLTITIDGAQLNASYVPETVTTGASLAPSVELGSGSLPFLQGDTARTVGLIFGAIAAALAAWAIAAMFQKDVSALDSVLNAYAHPYGSTGPEEDDASSGFAKNLLVKRAVAITENFAERQGLLIRAENALERADLPLRAGEALTVYVGAVVVCFAVGLVLGGSLLIGLFFAVAGALIPPAVVNFMANRRQKKFLSQLPDTLQLLSSTLRAGYSFMQGVEAVSQEVSDPMGGELRRVVTEAQLGRPVEDALDTSAERMDSPDFAWAVMAVKIQREVGGNLSELLMTVADTMTARERLRRDVSALTAEGKMSAIVLGALPILLGFAMYAMNPEYIGTLFEDPLGKILLVSSVVSALIGFAWMKKIIEIDI
jgi:tight adherence protein B